MDKRLVKVGGGGYYEQGGEVGVVTVLLSEMSKSVEVQLPSPAFLGWLTEKNQSTGYPMPCADVERYRSTP